MHQYRPSPHAPYFADLPRLEVRYEYGGMTRKTTIWLVKANAADYREGKPVSLTVARGLFRPRARTAAEADLMSQGGPVTWSLGVTMLLLIFGVVLCIVGLQR